MNQILCLSDRLWSSSPGRAQQLMSRLKETEILYFSPNSAARPQRVRSNITVCGLPALPPVPRLTELALHRRGRLAARTAARLRFDAPLLWATHPMHALLLDHIPHAGLVYDCSRDWEGLPPRWESSLARAADVVFAASPELADRLSPCSDNIALLPNGVTYPLFSGGDRPAVPFPLGRSGGPVIAFAGTLTEDLELAPILYAARQEPDWTFLLLGADGGAPLLPRLEQLPNVRRAGPVPLTEVPDYLVSCQVLVEPLHLDQAYSGVVSTRMYEYLATGRPIVSLLPPDAVESFPDVVYAAHSPEEFLAMCRRAMEEAPDFVRARRMEHARRAAWSERADTVSRILRTAGLL